MAYTLVPTELIVDGAVTSAKLDTNISISGTLGVTGELTLATHMIMGDNDKIKIGTGGDLEIYHDGSNSYISNSTGNIYLADTNGSVHIQAKLNEESIVCTADGAVSLYHDNAVKLATSSSGIDVTSNDSTNNSVSTLLKLSHTTTGTAADGIGTRINFESEDDGGTVSTMGYIDTLFTDVSDGAEKSAIQFYTRSGGSIARQMHIDSTGVGIGTTSLSSPLEVRCDSNNRGISIVEQGVGTETWKLGVNTDGDLIFLDSLDTTASVTFQDGTGYVGIGENNPDTALHVKTANDTVALLESSDATAKLQIKDSDSTYGTSLCVTNEDFFMQVNGGERMRVKSTGAIEIKGSSTTSQAQGFITNDNSVLTIGSSVSGSVVKDIAFASPSTMMYIDGSTANVGIGTDSPAGKLDVSVASNQRVRFDDFGGTSRISSRNDSATILPLSIEAVDLIINSGSGGNVGIGESSPSAKLSIGGGTANNYTDGISLQKSGGNVYGIYPSTNNLEFRSVTGGNHIATFDYFGKVGIGTESPSAKLDVNLTGAGDAVKITGNSITDFDFVANPPEFNLEDTSSSSGQKRARITLDTGQLNIQGLSDDDTAVTQQFITCDLSNGNVGIGDSSPSAKLEVNGSLKAEVVYSDTTASSYTSGQTISRTVSSTGEARVYQVFATRHTGTANKSFEMGYVFYSGNGAGSFSQVKDGTGISITVSGSTISATNTTGTATLYLTVLRLR